MNKITVIFTCFNRCGKTISCIKSLNYTNDKSEINFIAVDDNSSDQTPLEIHKLIEQGVIITLLKGTGGLYYSGGMRLGISYALDNTDSDYYLIINDDVAFNDGIIDSMVEYFERIYERRDEGVLVGCTSDTEGRLSYGAIRYEKGIKYSQIGIDDRETCDTFNANCVLIPHDIFKAVPNIDEKYIHSLGDFDYGFSISKRGFLIKTYDKYVGICIDNPMQGGWYDKSLGIRERIRAKENVKGAPFGPWFHYINKNFGLPAAVLHSFTPYIRILLGR
ncbi:MAG: glycosyltransferase [Lachnospiraceae bacterium]|nr:glycosyltransferase [Lachnospiraceae bacterium]